MLGIYSQVLVKMTVSRHPPVDQGSGGDVHEEPAHPMSQKQASKNAAADGDRGKPLSVIHIDAGLPGERR